MPAEIQPKGGFLLPPAPDLCQECAWKHEPDQPHNKQIMFYQINFLNKNGRYPTWKDAVAHCSPEVQRLWRDELEKLGEWPEPVEGMTPEMKSAVILGGLQTQRQTDHEAGDVVRPQGL